MSRFGGEGDTMAKDPKVERLRKTRLFARCSDRELAHIAAIADEVTIEAGREICKEGASARELIVIVEGTGDVTKEGIKVGEVEPGEAVGEVSLLLGGQRSATVTTTTPMDLYVIDGRRFDSVLDESPTIMRAMLEALSHRLRDLDEAYTH